MCALFLFCLDILKVRALLIFESPDVNNCSRGFVLAHSFRNVSPPQWGEHGREGKSYHGGQETGKEGTRRTEISPRPPKHVHGDPCHSDRPHLLPFSHLPITSSHYMNPCRE